MPHDVFISYTTEDKQVADAVCASLENHRIRCWIAPRDVTPGLAYGECITEAIQHSPILVLVFSARSNQSPHVMREVEAAVSDGKAILPFRIENVLPSTGLAHFLQAIHWLDAMTPPLEQHLKHMAETVTLLLQRVDHGRSMPPVPPEPTHRRWQGVRGRAWPAVWVALLLGGAAVTYFYYFRSPSPSSTLNGPNSPSQPSTSSPVIGRVPSPQLFLQTSLDGNQLRLLRCESSKWRPTLGVPGPTDFVDRPKLKRALSEILSVLFYTTVDRVIIGDFSEHDGELLASVTLHDSNLAHKKSYRSPHVEIGERELSISLFSESGKYYRVENIDDLAWDVLRLKNGIRSYLEATVANLTNREVFLGELQKDGSGSLEVTYTYKRNVAP